MSDLKTKLTYLASIFSKKQIPDLNEIFHENPTNGDLEDLIREESTNEQVHFSFIGFEDSKLKQAAIVLKQYYYCQEQTLIRLLANIDIDQKNDNLIKVLIWKKNIAAIRHYIVNNIVSEFNQLHWDLTKKMINFLFDDQFYSDITNLITE